MKLILKIACLVVLALVAVGIWVFMTPAAPALRAEITAAMEPIDERMGVYEASDRSSWLVVPGLSGGLERKPVDHWGMTQQVNEGALAEEGFRKAPIQPYLLENVTTQTDVHLDGWLFAPSTEPDAAVIILHGSGESNRSNSWYVYLAHEIARTNVAVILPDKRGAGRSGGDWRNVSFNRLAEDGAAWLEFLRTRYPNTRIGYVGVSQGGFVAPIAARLSNADFVVAQSASATTLNVQLQTEIFNDVRAAGVPEFLHPLLTAAYVLRAKNRRPDFWKINGDFKITEAWRAWGGPMFIAYGALDETDNLPVKLSVEKLEECCGDSQKIQWKVYEGVGHSLTDRDTDVFNEAFLAAQRDWILRSSTVEPNAN